MTRASSILALATTLAAAGVVGAATTHPNLERGFSADSSYAVGDVDHVALFNGNLIVTYPLGIEYPVGGNLSYRFHLVYNSKPFDFSTECPDGTNCYPRARVNPHANAGLGWQVHLGHLEPPFSDRNPSGRWVYFAPDGSEHAFYQTLHNGDPVTANLRYTRDGSYLRLDTTLRRLETPDGTRHTFDASGRLISMTDRFGNWVSVVNATAAGTETWTVSDSTGRSHTLEFDVLTIDYRSQRVLDYVDLAAFGGASARYDFTYTVETVERPNPHIDWSVLANETDVEVQNVRLLRSVTLPDGSQLAMPEAGGGHLDAYHRVRGNNGRASGNLRRLVLPTLGSLEWSWGPYSFPSGYTQEPGGERGAQLRYVNTVIGVAERRTYDAAGALLGTWTYAHDVVRPPDYPNVLPSEAWTDLTDPAGHRTRHYFSVRVSGEPTDSASADPFAYGLPFTPKTSSGGHFLSREVFADGADLVRSHYVAYEWDAEGAGPGPGDVYGGDDWDLNRRVSAERTVYDDDGSRFADVAHSDFDGFGHYRTTATGGNFPGDDTRTTYTDFNSHVTTPGVWPAADAWVLGTYTTRLVTDGSTARMKYCFDASTGRLKRLRVLVGSSPGEADVVTTFADTNGDGLTDVEAIYGGDLQAVGTGSNLCTLDLPDDPAYRKVHTYSAGALATSRYTNPDGTGTGIQFFLVDRTIDASTGLPSAVRDVAGIETALTYDAMGRLVSEDPAAGHGAESEYVYNPAASSTDLADVAVRRVDEAGTGVLAESAFEFDGFGRMVRERRKLPGLDWVARDTEVDSLGRRTRSSTWYDEDPLGTKHWTQYLDYDAFGRAGTIRPPDGTTHDVTVAYKGVRQVSRTVKVATGASGGETAQTRIERYDRQGRLYQVVEDSGVGGAAVTTTYGYDVGNRLASVQTVAGVTQNRSFVYDHRGFLLSEMHPEKSAAVTYSGYDALGSAGRKVDGTSDLTFTYDSAARLVAVRETVEEGEGALWKSFRYATANGTTDWKRGRVDQARRWNRYEVETTPTLAPGEIFSDGFECGDLAAWGGEPSCGTTTVDYEVAVTEDLTYGGVGGRLSQRDTTIHLTGAAGSETFTQGWGYTELGDVASLEYPRCDFSRCTGSGGGTSRSVGYSYEQGLVTGIPGYSPSVTYHPSGLVNQVYHSGTGVPRWVQSADANGMARPSEISARTMGAVWSTGTYGFDGAGNVKKMGDSKYAYDQVSRLSTASVSLDILGSGGLAELSRAYTYDAFGNLVEIAGASGRSIPTDSTTNRLTGAVTYDVAGNLTGWNGNLYTYDPFHMMTRYQTAGGHDMLHVYTADDERMWSYDLVDGTSRYTLRDLGNQVLREYSVENDDWTIERDYVYQGRNLLVAATPQGRRHFFPDHLGTPRLVTDNAGNQVAFHTYFPFGEEATSPFQDAERLKFTGHERDLGDLAGAGDDLDYMHARFCSPWTARFLSVDPVNSAEGTLPQSWNRYAYALNNPLQYVDPDGKCAVPAGLKEGQVGICIESFIAAPRIGGIGFGDNRGFEPNDAGATFRTSLRMIIDPQAGQIVASSQKAGVTEVGLLSPMIGVPGTTSVSGSIAPAGDGSYNVSVFISGRNGLAALNNLGDISILANMSVNSDGNVEVDQTSRTKAFPSIEGFAYRIVQGELVIEVLFRVPEQNPSDLDGPMDVPLAE